MTVQKEPSIDNEAKKSLNSFPEKSKDENESRPSSRRSSNNNNNIESPHISAINKSRPSSRATSSDNRRSKK